MEFWNCFRLAICITFYAKCVQLVTETVTSKTFETQTATVTPNTTLPISTDTIEELTEQTTRNELTSTLDTSDAVPTIEKIHVPTELLYQDRTLCFPAEIYTAIQAGVIVIVAVVAGVIALFRRKKQLQHETSFKNSLYKSSKSDVPNRTMSSKSEIPNRPVENDDDYLNTSLESDLPSRVAAKTNNDYISELLQSQIPRSNAADAVECLSGLLQNNVHGLNVTHADVNNDNITDPRVHSGSAAVHNYVTKPSVHTGSVAVHDYVKEPGVNTVSVAVHDYVNEPSVHTGSVEVHGCVNEPSVHIGSVAVQDYVNKPSVHTGSVAVHDYVNEPGVRTVSVAVHDYVDTNYDELVSQRVDEHCYVPLTT
ncbi:uncharacterized protein LOC128549483 [Mercenaria mercenaria]|uniref:uncharacterized protein LOC128549483 n=1 Tax=Mercenaria mercenaria TaxID=6596 RepID=UPI00234FA738|nr:uncharacterized protein LOC128549483 [Mercenaria mercenaria]